MAKCKLKCDKEYGGRKGCIDADFIDTQLLYDILKNFTKDNVLEITESVVDFYNVNRQAEHNKKSFKTANVLLRHIRKIIKENDKQMKIKDKVLDKEGMERKITDVFTNENGKKVYELDNRYLKYLDEFEFL